MSEVAPVGLRERKKRKLRESIRATALALFAERGYGATTLEQIAAAAEVAPRTLYRYFPTKDTLVVTDEDDERMLERFRLELQEHPPIEAFRLAFRAVMFNPAVDDFALRVALVNSEPELQASMLHNGIGLAERYAQAIVERTGRPEDWDLALSLAGAVIGLGFVTVRWDSSDDWETQMARLDAGLARLEAGFPFTSSDGA